MSELRQQRVDLPDPCMFSDHRRLAKYFQKLKIMELTLQDLIHSEVENNPIIVEAVYNYISHAHSVYLLYING